MTAPDWLCALADTLARGRPAAVATVVCASGSAPQPLGAKLIVTADGPLCGSVSAGCVEAETIAAAHEVMAGAPPRHLVFGRGDGSLWSTALACGGTLEVWVEAATDWQYHCQRLLDLVDRRRAAAVLTRLGPSQARLVVGVDERAAIGAGNVFGSARATTFPEQSGRTVQNRPALADDGVVGSARATAFLADLSRGEVQRARAALHDGESALLREAAVPLFVDVVAVAPRLVIVGACHIAQCLVPLANGIGFETVLVDPRGALAAPERFPGVDRILVRWPDEALGEIGLDANTYVAVVSHDDRLDVPALATALRFPVAYVGALGSRRTQAARRSTLAAAGMTTADLDRIRGPIGLDLGARGASEIALAVAAELLQARRAARRNGQADQPATRRTSRRGRRKSPRSRQRYLA